jgi:hypothetical protein
MDDANLPTTIHLMYSMFRSNLRAFAFLQVLAIHQATKSRATH